VAVSGRGVAQIFCDSYSGKFVFVVVAVGKWVEDAEARRLGRGEEFRRGMG